MSMFKEKDMEELNVTGEVVGSSVKVGIGQEAAQKVMEAFGPDLAGGNLVVRLEAVLEAVGGRDWQFASLSMFRAARPTLAEWGITFDYESTPDGMLVYFKVDPQVLHDLKELAEEVGPALLARDQEVADVSMPYTALSRLVGLGLGIGLAVGTGWVGLRDRARFEDYYYAPIEGYVDDDPSYNYEEE